MSDVKAWRRSIMSDLEAWRIGSDPNALDEFVRRLGEKWAGVAEDFLNVGIGGHDKRPAVLFVQPEKPKALSDAERIERALAIAESRSQEGVADFIRIARILRGDKA